MTIKIKNKINHLKIIKINKAIIQRQLQKRKNYRINKLNKLNSKNLKPINRTNLRKINKKIK